MSTTTHDVAVVGGSYAGISAALQLARARKSVLVIDAGARRNRFASHSHGFLGRDGVSPAIIADEAKAQLLAYPNVDWIDGRSVSASGALDDFTVVTEEGNVYRARRIILAGGVEDVLPSIEGLAKQWGINAFACPYCHGYEMQRGRLAVLATGPLSVHQAIMVSEWGMTTLFANGTFEPQDADHADLERRGVAVNASRIARVTGELGAPVLVMSDGSEAAFDGLFVTPKVRLTNDLHAQLGCAIDPTAIGDLIKVDAMQATNVEGVFACGDAASPMASIAMAVSKGAMAGVATHRSLIFPAAATAKAA
ncbi:NAD(P)/FAD-dependent oxidoreductase [Aliihoeflea sp. PC F10.4]